MESKNVKVIDEHNIDRVADIICKFTTNNIDYVLYAIERDGDNDNLFVSKLVNNIDGTASMVNIEDSGEKTAVNDLAKKLVMHAIKNENDVTTSKIKLPDGTEIDISSVLFNKDQNINVGKTYITTVKKTATKVSEKFYQVENKKEEVLSEPVVEAVPKMPEVETPVLEEPASADHEPTNEEIMNSFVEPPVNEEKVEAVPVPEESKEEPAPVLPEVEEVKEEVKTEPVLVPEVTPEPVKVEEPVTPIIPTASAVPASPVLPEKPEVVEKTPELIFDASKETNLNIALGEVTSDTSVKVDDASPIREFGQDDVVAPAPEVQAAPVLEEAAPVKTLKRSKGFANNKFVTVIAVLFFVAACVFLGYELFNYFQLTK